MTDRLPRVVLVLLVAASLTITLAGIQATRSIIGPAFLALVLTITVHPIRRRLAQTRLPDWAVSLIVVVSVYLLLLAMTVAIGYAVARLATLLPTYVPQLEEYLKQVGSWLESRGVGESQVQAVVGALDFGQLVGVATDFFSAALGLLSNLFFIITLALFMAFDTRNLQHALDGVAARRSELIESLAHFAQGTRSYMAVSAGFGLIVAIIDYFALEVIGVPGAFVWAVLAFVTNFIPNIGFVIGVIPPALIGLLEGGPKMMIAVIVVYSVINVVIQSIIQPRYVGDKVGLSPTITMLSLVFWAWAIGPLGALLAVPLSLLARALLVEADPDARWALPVIAGRLPRDPSAGDGEAGDGKADGGAERNGGGRNEPTEDEQAEGEPAQA